MIFKQEAIANSFLNILRMQWTNFSAKSFIPYKKMITKTKRTHQAIFTTHIKYLLEGFVTDAYLSHISQVYVMEREI